jgi:hypothetical protein
MAPPSSVGRAVSYTRDTISRVERRVAKRYSDVELRQLRSMERAYGANGAPELLMFGESNMVWTLRDEEDRRHLAEMIRDDVGGGLKLEGLVGPGYNPRIIMAMLTALPACPAQPKVVIVPMSILMATSSWLAHPVLGYEVAAQEMREVIAGGGTRPKRLSPPTDAAWEAYDHRPAPSLIGARRTMGEVRLITSATPTTRWQQAIRLRHLMDSYNAETLEPHSPGVLLVAEMAAMLTAQGLKSVAYIPPINLDVCGKTLGDGAGDHIRRNAAVLATAYQDAVGDNGSVVNAVAICPGDEFADPLHLKEAGRRRLSSAIASAIRPLLA